MSAETAYQTWRKQAGLPQDLADELKSIEGNDAAIEDRFYRHLEFGTGGLRGVLGAGTNRMNIFTVRKATAGFGSYLRQTAQAAGVAQASCVVGYDCRRMSPEFAVEVGRVLAAQGIKTYVFRHLCPTPELSFAVRYLGAQGGIMITASHNPPEYNGYKVYDKNGCQVLPDDAEVILREIEAAPDLFEVPTLPLDEAEAKGLFEWVSSAIDEAYTETVVNEIRVSGLTAADREQLHVVYTPLHGTGNHPVRDALRLTGYEHVTVVPEQAEPDGEFSTVKSPNPEEAAALAMAVDLARTVGADLAMGTDPDADRVGIAVRVGNAGTAQGGNPAGAGTTGDGSSTEDASARAGGSGSGSTGAEATSAGSSRDDEYVLLSGNQVGGLLVDFVLHRLSDAGALPENGIVLKTIVTSELGAESARQLGVHVEDTLTGFKYIGDRIEHYEKTGSGTFLFGYEESYGYLAKGFVRDKDAVQICLLIAEMAAFYKRQGRTLLDALEDLYQRVGYFEEKLISETLPGVEGVKKIGQLMEGLRQNGLSIPSMDLAYVEDYQSRERTVFGGAGAQGAASPAGHEAGNSGNGNGGGSGSGSGRDGGNDSGSGSRLVTSTEPLTLPQADVLKYGFTNGSWLAVRPSGTEPKIKFYVGAKGNSREDCSTSVATLYDAVQQVLDTVR